MAGHNHHPWCTCGWCTGGWGKGITSSHKNRLYIPLYKWDYSYIHRIYSYKSFLNPNARCPVCYERVFFYQSPYGGKVFFDELGPPWKKHPCTTKDKAPIKPYDIDVHSTKTPSWQRYEWIPYVCKTFSSKDNFCELTCDNEVITCYLPKDSSKIKEGSLIYLRKINAYYMEASLLLDENISKNIILSKKQMTVKAFEVVIMEKYTKMMIRNSKTHNIPCNEIEKHYYEILVNDPTTTIMVLTYIFFRFYDDKYLIKNIARHSVSIKSGMSDIFEYIIKLGMKGFMDNFYKSYRYYEDKHIEILKNVQNVPIANGIKKIINKKQEKLQPSRIKSNFENKGWLVK